MKKVHAFAILILIFSQATYSFGAEKHNYQPLDGYVPDADTAIRIATAVWVPIYGVGQIQGQAPYNAYFSDGIWTVTGSLPKDEVYIDENGEEVVRVTVGGVALIEIEKESGCILRVSHSK